MTKSIGGLNWRTNRCTSTSTATAELQRQFHMMMRRHSMAYSFSNNFDQHPGFITVQLCKIINGDCAVVVFELCSASVTSHTNKQSSIGHAEREGVKFLFSPFLGLSLRIAQMKDLIVTFYTFTLWWFGKCNSAYLTPYFPLSLHTSRQYAGKKINGTPGACTVVAPSGD